MSFKNLHSRDVAYIQWALTHKEESRMNHTKICERFKISRPTIQKILDGLYGGKIYDKERQINKTLTDYLDKLDNVFYFKNNQVVRRGLPDFIICFRGWFVGIECKLELKDQIKNGDRYKQQRWILKKIEKAGGLAITCHPGNIDEVKDILKTINEELENDRIKLPPTTKSSLAERARKTIASLAIFPEDKLQPGESD
jgi:hypothetical protein